MTHVKLVKHSAMESVGVWSVHLQQLNQVSWKDLERYILWELGVFSPFQIRQQLQPIIDLRPTADALWLSDPNARIPIALRFLSPNLLKQVITETIVSRKPHTNIPLYLSLLLGVKSAYKIIQKEHWALLPDFVLACNYLQHPEPYIPDLLACQPAPDLLTLLKYELYFQYVPPALKNNAADLQHFFGSVLPTTHALQLETSVKGPSVILPWLRKLSSHDICEFFAHWRPNYSPKAEVAWLLFFQLQKHWTISALTSMFFCYRKLLPQDATWEIFALQPHHILSKLQEYQTLAPTVFPLQSYHDALYTVARINKIQQKLIVGVKKV